MKKIKQYDKLDGQFQQKDRNCKKELNRSTRSEKRQKRRSPLVGLSVVLTAKGRISELVNKPIEITEKEKKIKKEKKEQKKHRTEPLKAMEWYHQIKRKHNRQTVNH